MFWCVSCLSEQTKGWSKAAQVEFRNVVGSAAVEMRPLGQDRDSLLVDLRKAPMEQSIDVPISVREYLVFIEVARYACIYIRNLSKNILFRKLVLI